MTEPLEVASVSKIALSKRDFNVYHTPKVSRSKQLSQRTKSSVKLSFRAIKKLSPERQLPHNTERRTNIMRVIGVVLIIIGVLAIIVGLAMEELILVFIIGYFLVWPIGLLVYLLSYF